MSNIARKSPYVAGIIAGLAILAVFVRPTPAPQKPEKIKAGPVLWDGGQQAFVVPTSLMFGLATAGEAAGFSLRTKIDVLDPNFAEVAGLGPQVDPVEWREGSEPDENGFVDLVAPTIPWDRNGGTVAGTVVMSTTIVLINPSPGINDGERREFPISAQTLDRGVIDPH